MSKKLWTALVVAALVVGASSACATEKAPVVDAAGTSTAPPRSTESTSTVDRPASSTTSPPVGDDVKATFVARGNEICAEMNRRSEAVGAVTSDPDATPEQVATALEQSGEIVSDAITQLQALPQPPEDASQLAVMYTEVGGLVALVSPMAAAVRAYDMATLNQLGAQLEAAQARANAAANAVGLTECGK